MWLVEVAIVKILVFLVSCGLALGAGANWGVARLRIYDFPPGPERELAYRRCCLGGFLFSALSSLNAWWPVMCLELGTLHSHRVLGAALFSLPLCMGAASVWLMSLNSASVQSLCSQPSEAPHSDPWRLHRPSET